MSATADHAHDAPDDHHAAGSHADHHDPNLAHHFDTMEQQFESGKLGMWVFLATEILMFGGLFCAYAIYRGNNPEIFLFAHQALDTQMGAINTAVLLASSFTMAIGVKAASQGRNGLLTVMLILTLLGGVGFMGIKTVEYMAKWEHGLWYGNQNAFYSTAEGYKDAEGNADLQRKEDAEKGAIKYIEDHGKKHAGAVHGPDGAHGGEGAHGGGHAATDPHGATAAHGGDAPPSTDSGAQRPGTGADGEVHPGPVEKGSAVAATGGGAEAAPAPEHGNDHEDQHTGPAHAGAHAESPAEVAAGRPGANPAVEPGSTTGVNLQEDSDLAAAEAPGTLQANVEAVATGGSAAWPPVPADHMSLAAPVNLAAATNAPFLNAPPEVGVVKGMVVGSAEVQAAELAGPKYPGFENLSPLDQERTHIFFQIYFVMTGLHGLHVLIGMGLIAWVLVKTLSTGFGPAYYAPVDIVGLYWHLVDLIWIFLFPLLYLIH